MKTIAEEKVTRDVHINDIAHALAASNVELRCLHSETPLEYYIDLMNEDESYVIRLHRSLTSPQSYYLNLCEVAIQLKAVLIESIAHHCFGIDTRRIWRILYDKGCMSELLVSSIALLPIKTTRSCLTNMLYSGLIFAHNIPRSMDFSTSRTLFLWGVDVNKTSAILARNAYRMLSDIKEFKNKQIIAHQRLLDKLNRIDVISGEAQLSEKEREISNKIKTLMCDLAISESKISEILIAFTKF